MNTWVSKIIDTKILKYLFKSSKIVYQYIHFVRNNLTEIVDD